MRSRAWEKAHPEECNARRERYRQDHMEEDANKSRRRRAAILNNGVVPYRDSDIFERDEWVCKLCLDPVDATLPRSSKWGATIDHVLPISKGGADAPENVQLAHRVCNVRKGDRILINV